MCPVEDPPKSTTHFECVSPIFSVADLQASLKYYVEVLGFKVNWETPGFAEVSRGRCGIMLAEGEQGHPGTWVWVGIGDADLLYAEYLVKGARIRHPPNNYEWAYELQVYDLDNNVLRLGSDNKKDQPLGTWLDMNGVEWKRVDDKWVRADPAQTSS
jgi:catechol 2,3-dioxygenase-like lactoylglutathione lyase family enzyme